MSDSIEVQPTGADSWMSLYQRMRVEQAKRQREQFLLHSDEYWGNQHSIEHYRGTNTNGL